MNKKELLAENEQLRWKLGSELVDLREKNELLRKEFNELKVLAANLVSYTYADEERHYEESEMEDHIFHTIKALDELLNQ